MNNYHQNGIDYPEVIPQPKIPEDLTPLEKAKRILQFREDVKICVEANICPICGSALADIHVAQLYKHYPRVYCTKDHSHFCIKKYQLTK